MLDQSIKIVPATLDDADAVRTFLRFNFIQDAPLNKYLKVSPCVEIEEWGVNLLRQGFSFKAVNVKNEMVGILLNTFISKETHFFPNDWKSSNNDGYKTAMKFFYYLEMSFNLFERYPEYTNMFEVGVMSVNSEYRGAGIATALMKSTLELVQSLAVPMCYCVCSSQFSAIICEKTGFEAVYRLPYKDYVVDGSRPVQPEEPHTEAVLYVLKI